MDKPYMKNNKLTILLHISTWFLLIILPQIIISRYWYNNFIDLRFYFNVGIYGIIFYINYLWLVPQYYSCGKKVHYFALALTTVVVLYFVLDAISQITHDPERDKIFSEIFEKLAKEKNIARPPFHLLHVYGYSLSSIVITGFSLGLRVIEQHSAFEKRQKELEKEKLSSELAFLKNQISPHFFFNTLNNIYSLIEINSNDAQESVLKLSKLMRYLLYESEHGQTMLSREIDFMNNYIDLMRIRLSNKVELNIQLPEEDVEYNIPPLLFIPFIENAFKHGISYREKSFISIFMEAGGNTINFKCVNSIRKQSAEEKKDNHSGVGLENVKKRLNLLFPEKHKLEIKQVNESFNVQLLIELK